MNGPLICRLLAAWAIGTIAAQPPEPPVFRGGGDVVRVFATVTNRDGRLVT
ncbi:MAG: hypothetical protein JF601_07405, partial [Acidobacteria bacterium]|nr:hypothetical protein [Acidobacteriota bacterium]